MHSGAQSLGALNCQIWSDLIRLGQIWPDLARFGQIRSDLVRLGQTCVEVMCDGGDVKVSCRVKNTAISVDKLVMKTCVMEAM